MGSPVSALVVNLYMEFSEGLALESAPTRPILCKQYVDDTCCIMKEDAADKLIDHLNSVQPTIKFIVELEKDGALPFLDTLLQRKQDDSLNITVYGKPIHTDRCLHFSSHHPTHARRGLVKCLYNTARNIIISQEDLQKE